MSSIELNKKLSDISREARKYTKGNKCMICRKECTSFCDSHTLPRFIIKEIADNGKVYTPAYVIDKLGMNTNIVKGNPGINETFIFGLLCNDCDNVSFKGIESKEALNNIFGNHQYNLFALKILLRNYYVKILNSNFLNIGSEKTGHPEIATASYPYIFDVFETTKEIEEYLDAMNKGLEIKNIVIIDEFLSHKVNFACTTQITPEFSFNGKKINDLNNFDKFATRFGAIYVSIIPFDNTTRVLMYYRRKYVVYNEIKAEFDKMTLEDKLKALAFFILLHSEEIIYNNQTLEIFKEAKFLAEANFRNNIPFDQYMYLKKKFMDSDINFFK